jgi:hypothetical protein
VVAVVLPVKKAACAYTSQKKCIFAQFYSSRYRAKRYFAGRPAGKNSKNNLALHEKNNSHR